MYKSILHLLIIINILICLFILLGGLLSPEYAKFNIYIFIPLIYLLNILPFDILTSCQHYIAGQCINNYPEYKNKEINEIIDENSNIYILPDLRNKISKLYNLDTFNPVNYQGLLVLGYILNIYILKYKWNDF